MRTFISIDMPEEVKKKIIEIQKNLPEFFGKKTEPENLHLTLKFLGEIDENKIEEVKKKLREINFNKFESEIDSIGVFSEQFVRIVWLHLSGCEELQKEIDKSLRGLFDKENRFMSHLTIARVKKLKNKENFLEDLKKIEIPSVEFDVKEFYLMKSELSEEGPKYSIIEKYNLI